jgi:hypothetical protein
MGCHRPADHAPAAGIEDEGQVDEALSETDAGYVRHTQPIRCFRGEVPFDQIWSGLLARYAVGGLRSPSRREPLSFARLMRRATRFLEQLMPMAPSSACTLGAP